DVPGGQGEHLLAPEYVPEERRGPRGAVRAEGLHAVSEAVAVHAVEAGATDHRVAAPRAARGAAGGPPRAGDRGGPATLRGPGRHRGHTRAGDPAVRVETVSLYR